MDLYTVGEMAALFHVPRETMTTWMKLGTIPTIRTAGGPQRRGRMLVTGDTLDKLRQAERLLEEDPAWTGYIWIAERLRRYRAPD